MLIQEWLIQCAGIIIAQFLTLSAPKQLVANTDSNTSKVKGSTLHRHKQILSQQMDCDIQKVKPSVGSKTYQGTS